MAQINGTTEEAPLFNASLTSSTIQSSLPESYVIRPLKRSDYSKGFLDTLRVLTTVGDISEAAWDERYKWMSTQGAGGYYVLVIEDTASSTIVGTGALIVERKL